MRTAIAGLMLLGTLAVPAIAQDPSGSEEYCFTASLNQATRVNLGRRVHNETTCNAAALAVDCTQAQLDAAGGDGTIYDNSLSGRITYILAEALVPWFLEILSTAGQWEQIRARLNWCAGDQAFKNTACAALGLEAGCVLTSCP